MASWFAAFDADAWREFLGAGAEAGRLTIRNQPERLNGSHIAPGDLVACYVKYDGLWVGVLELAGVTTDADEVRFTTASTVAVDLDQGLFTDEIRAELSLLAYGRFRGFAQANLRAFPTRDAGRLLELLEPKRRGFNPSLPPRPDKAVPQEIPYARGPALRRAEPRWSDLAQAHPLVRTPHLTVPTTPLMGGSAFDAIFHVDSREPAEGEHVEYLLLEGPLRVRQFTTRVLLFGAQPFRVEVGTIPLAISRDAEQSARLPFRVHVDADALARAKVGSEAALTAVVTHHGRPRGFVQRVFEVARASASRVLVARDGGPPRRLLSLVPTQQDPDLTVFVVARDPDLRNFTCTIQSPHLDDYREGVTEDWILPQRLDDLVRRYMQTFVEGQPFTRRAALRGAGREIFRVAPQNFKDAYWALRDTVPRFATIFVVSDEPYVPWELMVPERIVDDVLAADDVPLGVSQSVSRWCTTAPSPPADVAITSGLVVAPPDSGLPSATAESDLVCVRFNGRRLAPATAAELDAALRDPSCGLVHFVCHGEVDATGGIGKLILEGGDRLAPHIIGGMSGLLAGFARDRPLVFINACEVGRGAPSLIDSGGFPRTFCNVNASCVVAPLWEVEDDAAFDAAKEFYDLARGNVTLPLAEILALIRGRAYSGGPSFDDTYAAYTYWGDPHARLTRR